MLKIIALIGTILFCLVVNIDYYVTKAHKIETLEKRVDKLEQTICKCQK